MSEQTPDTNNDVSDGQDPSMEDILASIRKIIAEDDGQSLAIPDENAAVMEPQALQGDVSDLLQADSLDLDIIADDIIEAPEAQSAAAEADIDTLIGDMDVEGSEDILALPVESIAASDDPFNDVLDLEIPMDEPETALDEMQNLASEEPLVLEDEIMQVETPAEEQVSLEPLAAVATAAAVTTVSQGETLHESEDDLSLMLGDVLEDSAPEAEFEAPVIEAPIVEDRVIDPAEDLLAEIDLTEDIDLVEETDLIEELTTDAAAPATDPDMDLVKSLMADLTEEPLHDDGELDSVEVEASIPDIDDVDDEASDDVLDEILSITLDDETKLSEEIAIPEIEVPVIEPATIEASATENLSLKDIAAAAEADAAASDGGVSTGLMAGLGAAAIGGAAIAAGQDDEPELETAPDDVDSALSQLDDILADDMAELDDLTPEDPETQIPEPLIEETPHMARAKKSDAIIDEVTETATAGAFASLSNVVEEKATVAERGDRIGDLVMEALQPMLKEWLDANLKGIVERAVTKEVKRISSGK